MLELKAYVHICARVSKYFNFADKTVQCTNRIRHSYSSSPDSVTLFDEIPDVPAGPKDGTVIKDQKEKYGGEF